VVLFDELEKAHPNIWDLLLPLLDEGRLTGPDGDTVDFRQTIVIATSNVGARDAQAARSLGFGATGADPAEARSTIRRALEHAFRPEFLNRFQHLVVFHGLSLDQMRTIARHEVNAVLAREGIASRGLAVDVDDAAIDFVIARGVDARFGARALKREVQRTIVLPLAMTLMEKPVGAGAVLRVTLKDGEPRVRVIETESSREATAAAAEAVRARATRADLLARIARIDARVAELASAVREAEIDAALDSLNSERQAPDFWKQRERVDQVQRELDRLVTTAERLKRLRARAADLRAPLDHRGPDAPQLDRLSANLATLETAVDDAHLELVALTWDEQASALVEVRPLGPGRRARDLLVRVYHGWAEERSMHCDWMCEPCDDAEPAVFAVKGSWAYGYLRDEAGLHRIRLVEKDGTDARFSVAAVRVAAWTERRGDVFVTQQRALKTQGQHDGKVRSRIECRASAASGPLVLQNARTIAENRELAADRVASWSTLGALSEEIVRRYDEEPALVRDTRTEWSSGRPDALSPRRFDELLKRRIAARG
jgi:protein subunit release factor A